MSSESTKLPKTDENLKTISKYFLHGFTFSIITIGLVIVWLYISVILVALGSLHLGAIGLFIGLIIGFIVFFFMLGGLNSFLTERIWSISIKKEWMSLLGHGLLLFTVLIIAHIPYMIVDLVWPSSTIAMLFFEAFINGIVAKKVASWWKEGY